MQAHNASLIFSRKFRNGRAYGMVVVCLSVGSSLSVTDVAWTSGSPVRHATATPQSHPCTRSPKFCKSEFKANG